MNSERSRLRTFQSWPSNSPVGSKRIAKAGFYFIGNDLEVQCFACGGRISDWNYNDCVMTRHRALDPRCPFVKNIETSGNISIEDEELFKTERGRLASFINWPVPFIVKPEDLAKTGFFYLKQGDWVKCAFCCVIIMRWEQGDTADGEHRRQSPKCPFLLQQSHNGGTNNLTQPNIINYMKLDEDMRDLGVQNHRIPKHVNYSTFDSRLQSYTHWPRDNPLRPEQLASSGFFYEGREDQVRCFHCDGGLLKWTLEDDPWKEHARWFPECHYVLLVKGEQFIEETIKSNPPITISDLLLTPKFFTKSSKKKPTVTNEQVQEYMSSPQAIAALQIGLEASRVKTAIRQRLESSGSSFSSADSLIEAVLDVQFDEHHETPDTEEDAWGTPPESLMAPALSAGRNNNATTTIVIPSNRVPERSVGTSPTSSSSSSSSSLSSEIPFVYSESPPQETEPTSYVREPLVERIVEESALVEPEVTIQDEEQKEDILVNIEEKIEATENDYSNLETFTTNTKAQKESLEDELRRLKEARLCKICMDNEVSVVLLPCGHLVACAVCASSLPKCPVCRESIKATVRTFLS